MHRICFRIRPLLRFPRHRNISSSSSRKPINSTNTNVQDSTNALPSIPDHSRTLSPISSQSLSRTSVIALSAAVVSAVFASVALLSSDHDESDGGVATNPLYAGAELAVHKAGDSLNRIFHHAKRTGVAASVLWQSLHSVLSSANHEVRSGFEIRVAALLADIAAANSGRRAAIVGAGGGAVVDWLLESVAVAKNGGGGTQAESARALAYLIADPNVSAAVLGRPHAVPNLLRFIFSCQPRRSKNKKKHSRRSAFDISDSLKGRSMLVAAIMDIVTSSCDSAEVVSFKPSLPGNAETRDIAAALQVIEEGGLHLDEPPEGEDDDGDGTGGKGIGIKILEGTTVLGLSRNSCVMESDNSNASHEELLKHRTPQTLRYQNKYEKSLAQENMSSAVVPGLWDDLHCEHVAVPFATWALANWATASRLNRSHIQELDQDGNAIMSALMAPERTVKWHASLVVRLLLEDRSTPLNESVSDWGSNLLSTISQACKHEDFSLARVSFSAFLLSVERSPGVQKIVMEKGLNSMRDIAKQTTKDKQVQESMAKALELLCTGDLHLSLEESQKWSGILLPWVFGTFSSDTIRSSAIKILSQILEDYGPTTVPLSQGWLVMMLSEVQSSIKKSNDKGTGQPKSDNVKTLINNSNIASAAQVATQLSSAVVNLAAKQVRITSNSGDASPLADFLSLEPFAGPFKNLKKDSMPKLDAADSAFATLKGIKVLTEVCAEDCVCLDKIVDFGILCLLRRFLLSDDYEKLAAIEAYNASSKAHEGQERISNVNGEPPISDVNDSASVRVPPTAHIRRHAARLLTILSLLPKVKKVIIADETWCQWLDECANGRIPGCTDLKMQSYARAVLLNIFCNDQLKGKSESGTPSDGGIKNYRNSCPRYDDRILLINSHLPHWKCPKETDQQDNSKDTAVATSADTEDGTESLNDGNSSNSIDSTKSSQDANCPPLDVVFVHGLRGGPFKTWRIAEDKSSTTSTLVEKIDEEAGKLGTFWPGEWLSSDFPEARLFTIKYKTNLTQWSGASLPLQVTIFPHLIIHYHLPSNSIRFYCSTISLA
ncbi:uncharacterized protein LOC113846971 isoform X2 [Abrus precatorius]|uniref:Uncharacterized protein LOC113846971 isoform X2 n=1 Tax=Abrus precatorius TaxID=3816 RepID=A0A8B8JJI0_ABRPR|nr:uncharacterized protein LOC113846971 isoform X2 [Abrus precatorius]